jgi:hypothetical protein
MHDDDDTLLESLRVACAAQAEHPEREHDLPGLYALRDQALSRGLPVPVSCPMDHVAGSQ